MSARIGVMTKEGFRSVFLYNTRDMVKLTKFLLQNYGEKPKIKKLINGGDIHSIIPKLCYFTDLGDRYEDCPPYTEQAEALKDIDIQSSPVDYYFAFNKRWYISPAYELDNWKTAEKFLKNEEAKTSRP